RRWPWRQGWARGRRGVSRNGGQAQSAGRCAMMDLPQICATTTSAALARAATIAPDVEAVIASDGRMTYGQLRDEVARIAAALVAYGVKRGDHIGLCTGNSCRWVALFLAIGSLRAMAVPGNKRL